jgi:hypothetical protein
MLVERLPQRGSFMGQGSFMGPSRERTLGQLEWIIPVATGVLQSTPALIAAYNAKRAAERAKQDKQRAEQDAAAAKAKAEDAAKAATDAKKKADELLKAQGLTPQGTVAYGSSSNKILGLDPIVLAAGGLGILGVGAALWFGLGK